MIRSIMNMTILLCWFFLSMGLSACTMHHSGTKQAASLKNDPAAEQVKSTVEEASQAEPPGEQSNPFEYTPPDRECTRATLIDAAGRYIAAQEAGDLSKMSLAPDVRFLENMIETTREKGLWNTSLPIAFHRSIYDVPRCKTFTEVIVTEGGHPYVLGTRLTVDKGQVIEIDSLVTDETDWYFDADNYLKYSEAEDWPVLPLDDRTGRQELVDAANQYFNFLYKDNGIRPPWGTPCARLEGGELYTNPDNEDRDTCRKLDSIGDLFITDRTFVVDEEMGSVNIFCRYGESNTGLPDSHTFRLVNGKYRWIHTLTVNTYDGPIEVPEFTPKKKCECDRDMLKEATDRYIAAQKAGDLSKMSLAPNAKFVENMSETTKDNGLWNTPLPVDFHRSIYDVGRCKTFTEVIVTEGGHPYVIGTRLEIDMGEVTEINSLITDEDDWLFNAEDYLKYSEAEDWPVLHVDDRVSRQELINAANQYFDFVFMDKSIRPPWGTPCARLEGGAYTNPENEQKDTCRIPGPLGELFVENRTFVVDEEMGTVNVFCRLGDSKDGMPDSHTFRLVNGTYRWIHTLSVNVTGEPLVYPEGPQTGEGE